jgi:hypothetical protein
MSDAVVVLEVVLKTPIILESRETKVAIDLMVVRMIDVVLKPIPVHKDALAEIAVVFVPRVLLDVIE